MISRVNDRHRYLSIFFSQKKHSNTNKKMIFPKGRWPAGYSVFTMPERILLGKQPDRDILLDKVRKLHRAANDGKNIWLDFSATQKVYTHGMLYFYAEISNMQNLYPKFRIRCNESRNTKVNHVLDQIGLFALCKHGFTPQREYEDVVHWRAVKGIKVIGKAFDSIVDPDLDLPDLPDDLDIFGACVEATKNAFIHAYIEERQLSAVANDQTAWWMFSQIKDGKITVAICDLGIGIPGNLPKTNENMFMKVRKAIKGTIDAHLIENAILTPSSRTRKGYRGNGLKKIAKIAMDDSRASLVIHSGRGYVEIMKGHWNKTNFTQKFPGTLVAWKLPLEKQK